MNMTRTPTPEPYASRPVTLREILRIARPSSDSLFPDLYEDYEEYHAHIDTGHLARATLIASWIEQGSRVLDAGCGDGVMAEYLAAKKGASMEAIDISQTAVRKTQARGIHAHIHNLDEDPRLPDGFDYILFIEVLEHLRTPHRVLRDAVARARKAVIVTIPNSGWVGFRLQALLGHTPVQSFTHLHLWTHHDFLVFCGRLGFDPPELRYLSSGRGIRPWLLSRWPNLFVYQLAYKIAGSGPRLSQLR